MKTRIRLHPKGNVILVIAILAIYSTGCGNSSTGQSATETHQTPLPAFSFPTSTSTPLLPIETPFPSLTPSSPIATVMPTQTVVSTPTSTWKADWVDFVNDYYGYAISIPPSAEILKNDEVDSYDPTELPPDWNENESYFDHLNSTYPPGLCLTVIYQSGYIQIRVPDDLGGKYVDCGLIGGLGAETDFVWVWTEEEVIIGDEPHTATVLRKCKSHASDAKCEGREYYGISMGEGGVISLGYVTWKDQATYDEYLNNKAVLFEMLRTYRAAPKTELYCPKPTPTRLEVGGFAYVSTDPPLSYNNVREAPGINQTLIGKIEPGRAVELLEGPVCNNSLQWWKVRVSNTAFEGWTPEGDQKRYWLVPCESKESCGKP